MTDLLGTPSLDTISRVRNDKARKYLSSMRKKQPIPFVQKFPTADPLALKLLERFLAFDPKDRPTAAEALADPYFRGLAKVEREPSCQPIAKMEFEFERRRVTKEDIRELIFREILEYHPQLLKDYISGADRATFLYPSAVDQFKLQFAHLEENGGISAPVIPIERKHASLPRSTVHSRVVLPHNHQQPNPRTIVRSSQAGPQRVPTVAKPGKVVGSVMPYEKNIGLKDSYDPRRSTHTMLIPPQQQHPAIPAPAYYFQRSSSMSGKMESSFDSSDRKMDYVSQHHVTISASSSNSPFFQHLSAASGIGQASSSSKLDQSIIANEVSMFQSIKPPAFGNGIAASATNPHHRKVGAVQFGMSGMY